MRFLTIVLVAVTLVRLATSCENGQTTTVEETSGNNKELTDAGTFPDYIPTGLQWDEIRSDLKEERLPEVKSPDIYIRRSAQATLYTLDKDLLFTSEKIEMNPEIRDALEEIAASIRERYPQGRVYVYSHAGKNKETNQRKRLYHDQAVELEQWLVVHGHLDEARVFIYDGQNEPAHAPESLLDSRVPGEVVEIIAVSP